MADLTGRPKARMRAKATATKNIAELSANSTTMPTVLNARTSSKCSTNTISEHTNQISTDPTSPNAALKVFGIPELLEAIVLNLPPRNLFSLRIINTTFKATIERSPHAQRMFSVKTYTVDEPGSVTINPFALTLLRHYGVGCIISRTINDQRRFKIRSNDIQNICIPSNERLELGIWDISGSFFKQHYLQDTFKNMPFTDTPIDISITDWNMDEYEYGEIDGTAKLGDLFGILQRRTQGPMWATFRENEARVRREQREERRRWLLSGCCA